MEAPILGGGASVCKSGECIAADFGWIESIVGGYLLQEGQWI